MVWNFRHTQKWNIIVKSPHGFLVSDFSTLHSGFTLLHPPISPPPTPTTSFPIPVYIPIQNRVCLAIWWFPPPQSSASSYPNLPSYLVPLHFLSSVCLTVPDYLHLSQEPPQWRSLRMWWDHMRKAERFPITALKLPQPQPPPKSFPHTAGSDNASSHYSSG